MRLLAQLLDIDPGHLLALEPSAWSLSEHRVASGLHQADVTRTFGVAPTRLSNLELGYEVPRPDELEILAVAYHSTSDELAAAWQRGRDRLLAD